MNKLLTSIFMCLVAISAMAQNKAEIIVSYDSSFPNKFGKINTCLLYTSDAADD